MPAGIAGADGEPRRLCRTAAGAWCALLRGVRVSRAVRARASQVGRHPDLIRGPDVGTNGTILWPQGHLLRRCEECHRLRRGEIDGDASDRQLKTDSYYQSDPFIRSAPSCPLVVDGVVGAARKLVDGSVAHSWS